jgi:F420-dependent oxidoreductase-like protein
MLGAGADQDGSLNGLIKSGQRLEAMGFDSVWLANIFGLDAIGVLSLLVRETTRIEVGTAVVPSYPRHPSALAQQALTASVASDGRFVLGLGLSHKVVIEDMLGMSYDKPAKHMKEYLEVLLPLLRGESVSYRGDLYRVHCQLDVAGARKVPVIVAALGAVMLKMAGSLADGTTTWMTGPQTLENHIIPCINQAANDAAKVSPRVVAGLPIALTNDVAAAKAKIDKGLQIYGVLPSYRAMLDREGAAGPADVAMLGDEAALRKQLQRLRDMGVTDFNAAVMNVDKNCYERTLEFLQAEFKLDARQDAL